MVENSDNNIRRNFVYNLVLTVSGYLFPLLTYPYVSRIIGVEGIGVCNFVDSIITYYLLFSALGIGSYGVRKIATCPDENKRNEVFSNLLFIHAITTFIALIILVASIFLVDKLIQYQQFFYLGFIKIVFSLFLTNWFFQGISDFRYITLRGLIVNVIYTILVFVFIRDYDDAIYYYGLSTFVIVINACINWGYGKRYRKIIYKSIHIRPYIKPVFSFGLYNILTSLYTTFNIAFLGFVRDIVEVGYYTTATKLYTIILSVFTALTTVMIPVVSKMVENQDMERLNNIVSKTVNLLVVVSIPIIIFCELNAGTIVYLLSGSGYEGAVTPFRIVIFLILIIGIEQVVIQQVLLASVHNKAIVQVSLIGAVTGIVLNILLTFQMGAIGSSISWGCAELSVLIVGFYYIKKRMGISIDWTYIVKSIKRSLGYFLVFVLCIVCLNKWYLFFASGSIIAIYFLIVNLYINKNEFVISIWNKFFGKMLYIQLNNIKK